MKNVIFDLDGTLADTSGDLIAAVNACFQRLGRGKMLDPQSDAEVAFNGGRAMLRLGFERLNSGEIDEKIEQQFPYLIEYYGNNINNFTHVYENVELCLERLLDRGYLLGVCTNKPVGLANLLLEDLGLADKFGAVLGADSLAVRKPDPEHLFETIRRIGGSPDRSALIGDTMTDRATARAANIPCVLVTFGPKSRDVVAMEPDALLDHYDLLPEVLRGIGI